MRNAAAKQAAARPTRWTEFATETVIRVLGFSTVSFVLLIFLVSAAESLGLERVSATLDMLALYLPKVFGGALVLLVTYVVGFPVAKVIIARKGWYRSAKAQLAKTGNPASSRRTATSTTLSDAAKRTVAPDSLPST